MASASRKSGPAIPRFAAARIPDKNEYECSRVMFLWRMDILGLLALAQAYRYFWKVIRFTPTQFRATFLRTMGSMTKCIRNRISLSTTAS